MFSSQVDIDIMSRGESGWLEIALVPIIAIISSMTSLVHGSYIK